MNPSSFKACLKVWCTRLWYGAKVSTKNRCTLLSDNVQYEYDLICKRSAICFAWKNKNIILSTLCSLSKPHFWTASKWNCKILQSLAFLMLWETFKQFTNKTQLEVQTKSQKVLVHTLQSNGFMIMPWGTLEFNVHQKTLETEHDASK
jgi:hypothetical protein